MKNKKGSAIVWIIIAGVVIILGIVLVLIIANQKVKIREEELGSDLDLYVRIQDSNENSLSGDYTLLNTEMKKGKVLGDSFTEIKNISSNIPTFVLCEAEGYYSSKVDKYFKEIEKIQNSSKVICTLDQIGALILRSSGTVREGNSQIDLEIQSKGSFHKLELCVAWTPGIIDVDINKKERICEGEIWVNKSNQSKDLYACKGVEEYCEKVNIGGCTPFERVKPDRLVTIVDKCFYLGDDLNNEEMSLTFNIVSKNLNDLDSLTFYVFDNDVVYVGKENKKFDYLSEKDGINLGNSKDYTYKKEVRVP